jgi:hypothetical protein
MLVKEVRESFSLLAMVAVMVAAYVGGGLLLVHLLG